MGPLLLSVGLFIVIPLAAGVITVATLSLVLINSSLKEEYIRTDMSNYLKNKYNRDFKVDRPKLGSKGIGFSGTWSADAHPNDDDSMKFKIIRSEDKSSFADQYTALVWSKSEESRIKKIIEMMQKDMEVQRIYIVQKIQLVQKEHLQLQIEQQIHRKQKKHLIQKHLPKFMIQEQIIPTRKNIMKQQNILKI